MFTRPASEELDGAKDHADAVEGAAPDDGDKSIREPIKRGQGDHGPLGVGEEIGSRQILAHLDSCSDRRWVGVWGDVLVVAREGGRRVGFERKRPPLLVGCRDERKNFDQRAEISAEGAA